MLPSRLVLRKGLPRMLRPAIVAVSPFSTSPFYRSERNPIHNDPGEPNQPHLPNQSSTLTPDVPTVGKQPPPPEFLGTVDPNYTPQDAGSAAAKPGEVTGNQPPGHGQKEVHE